MNSIQRTARTAGGLYLLFLVTYIFSSVVRSKLIVFGDAAATANNIMASEPLYRIGFVSELLSALFFLSAAWALYVLLKPVNKDLALLFLVLNGAGVVVECLNALNLLAVLLLLSGADYLTLFPVDQLQAQAMFFLKLYSSGFIIAQLFYGTWLFPLGYLVFKSGYLPRVLGILLMIDCVAVLIWFFQFFLFPGYDVIKNPGLVVSIIAEISLSLWLLIKGVNHSIPALAEDKRIATNAR